MRHLEWLVLAAGFGMCGVGEAAQVRYDESARITGTLNGVAFADASAVAIATIDPAQITTSGGIQAAPNASISLVIDGVGVVGIAFATTTFNDGATAGLARASDGAVILGVRNAGALASFALAAPPIQSVIGPAAISAGAAFATSRGALVITSSGNATFLGLATPQATPEPSSLLMVATAAGLGVWRFRRRAA